MKNDISDNWIAYNIFCCCRIFGWIVVFNGNTKKGTREMTDYLIIAVYLLGVTMGLVVGYVIRKAQEK